MPGVDPGKLTFEKLVGIPRRIKRLERIKAGGGSSPEDMLADMEEGED